MREALAPFVRLRIDYSERAPDAGAVLGDLNISGLPSFVFLDRSGREVDRIEGPLASARLLEAVEKALRE